MSSMIETNAREVVSLWRRGMSMLSDPSLNPLQRAALEVEWHKRWADAGKALEKAVDDMDKDPERAASIRVMAQEQWATDECEIDKDAIVSEGDDNGAFVQAWVWVDFCGTSFDKEAEPEEEPEGDRFRNHYSHCGQEWSETADSMCNDRCPVCNREIEPTKSEELEEVGHGS